MSVFDNNKKNKSKKQYFAATSIDDTSTDTAPTPKSLDELVKGGRGEARNSKPQGQKRGRGRPKLEHTQEKEFVMIVLTKEQKDELKRRAEKANLSMSKYIMLKVFGFDT